MRTMVSTAKKSKPRNEKRRSHRHVLKAGNVLAYVKNSDMNNTAVAGTVYDLSFYGIRFVANQPCPLYSRMVINLYISKKAPFVKITGTVIGSKMKESGQHHVTVEFKRPDRKTQSLIMDYIDLIKSSFRKEK